MLTGSLRLSLANLASADVLPRIRAVRVSSCPHCRLARTRSFPGSFRARLGIGLGGEGRWGFDLLGADSRATRQNAELRTRR